MTLVLFPSQPFSPREIDLDFDEERSAARRAGLATALVDHTRVCDGDASGAVARVPEDENTAPYRGWMLRPAQYDAMYRALEARGSVLINDPSAYRACHYLPESYRWIEAIPRARSGWN
jgi:hypothetical protein